MIKNRKDPESAEVKYRREKITKKAVVRLKIVSEWLSRVRQTLN